MALGSKLGIVTCMLLTSLAGCAIAGLVALVGGPIVLLWLTISSSIVGLRDHSDDRPFAGLEPLPWLISLSVATGGVVGCFMAWRHFRAEVRRVEGPTSRSGQANVAANSDPETKTLDELEGIESRPPTFESYLNQRCFRLRKTPIGQFGVEDLRIMIGQGEGLQFLAPLALEVLEREPLAEGDLYPGDLLGSVLGSDPCYWVPRPDLRSRVDTILSRMSEIPEEVGGALAEWKRWT